MPGALGSPFINYQSSIINSDKERPTMTGMEIAQVAKQQLADLTGLKADTVSGMSKSEDGWHVNIDMIQMRCVPDCSDMLATYETLVDEQGDLLRYQRTKTFRRGEGSEET
jgi:hypothetical protein